MPEAPDGTLLPKNYQLVMEIIHESGHGMHRSMNDIYVEAMRRRPGIGNTTVYRALLRLCREGLVREVLVPGMDSATYEPMGPPHAHFRCLGCKVVTDVEYTLPKRSLDALADSYRFKILAETVTLEGYCSACAAKTLPLGS